MYDFLTGGGRESPEEIKMRQLIQNLPPPEGSKRIKVKKEYPIIRIIKKLFK